MEGDRDRIVEVFKEFDFAGKKVVEWEPLMTAMKMLNPSYASGIVEQALSADGKLRDGLINYEDFVDWAFKPHQGTTSSQPEAQAAAAAESAAAPRAAEEADPELAKIAAMKSKTRRPAVAAESMDNKQVENYQKPVYAKGNEATALIMKTLTENEKMKTLCGHLEGKDLDDLINAFYPKEFRSGEEIIRQGDDGSVLYIIDDGQVDIFVARPNSNGAVVSADRGSKVVTFGPGVLFGELALLYSAPRAATVVVATPVVKLWALDQLDFKMLLAQSAQQHYSLYEGWLRQVSILQTLNYYELSTLSELLDTALYDKDELIIQQGDPGDRFFILEEGTCAAYIQGVDGEKEVKRYETQGEYFGEVALLTDAPRKATIRATGTGCVVAFVSKDIFVDVLGPLSEILTKHSDRYPQYAQLPTGC